MSEDGAPKDEIPPHSSAIRDTVSLPITHVTNINVTASVVEITVSLGRMHSLLDPQTNALLPTMRVEWFRSLALNPIVAKQLHLSLGRAVEFYEGQYGKIPEDAGFRLTEDSELMPGRPVE